MQRGGRVSYGHMPPPRVCRVCVPRGAHPRWAWHARVMPTRSQEMDMMEVLEFQSTRKDGNEASQCSFAFRAFCVCRCVPAMQLS